MAGNALYEAYRDAVRVLACHHSLDVASKEKLLVIVAAIGCDRHPSGRIVAERGVTSIAVQYFRLIGWERRLLPCGIGSSRAAGAMAYATR